jgi:hypothetical protein
MKPVATLAITKTAANTYLTLIGIEAKKSEDTWNVAGSGDEEVSGEGEGVGVGDTVGVLVGVDVGVAVGARVEVGVGFGVDVTVEVVLAS